jgi:hypothetical protein
LATVGENAAMTGACWKFHKLFMVKPISMLDELAWQFVLLIIRVASPIHATFGGDFSQLFTVIFK